MSHETQFICDVCGKRTTSRSDVGWIFFSGTTHVRLSDKSLVALFYPDSDFCSVGCMVAHADIIVDDGEKEIAARDSERDTIPF